MGFFCVFFFVGVVFDVEILVKVILDLGEMKIEEVV